MWAFLKAIRPEASWSRARWFSSFFDQRIRIARLRLSQEWQASMTQRRARQPGGAGLELDLVTARADVRRESVGAEQLERVGVVVGPVEADALRLLLGRGGPLERDRLERALQQLVVVALGALVIEPDRGSLPFAEERPFRPLPVLSVGFGPVFGPPKGALVIAPSAANQAQSIPTTWS